MFKKILHANDGSEGAFRALSVALDLARQYKAELHSVSVEEISQFPETIEEVKSEKGAADRRFREPGPCGDRLLGHAGAAQLDCQRTLPGGHVTALLDVLGPHPNPLRRL